MPIFEYECRDCKHQFEIITTSSQQEPVTCPECNSRDVVKNMSASAIRIGSGAPVSRPSLSGGGCSPNSGFT
ncbi:MAG: hypothetical protein CSB34_04875 [Desulfobulbus propionicus]|nr:MAG: hypothetical protein CSB34_04875 [Desulfobulbus propionicus]PIE66480.1 MAG: hypothetical protein CSA26_00760 [Desulfobacterales bacterium]